MVLFGHAGDLTCLQVVIVVGSFTPKNNNKMVISRFENILYSKRQVSRVSLCSRRRHWCPEVTFNAKPLTIPVDLFSYLGKASSSGAAMTFPPKQTAYRHVIQQQGRRRHNSSRSRHLRHHPFLVVLPTSLEIQ